MSIDFNVWNPWHGCHKISAGCAHCYMHFLDRMRNPDAAPDEVFKTGAFYDPLKKDASGNWKIPNGSGLFICMTSDFFIEEADAWRNEIWDIVRERPGMAFKILTKRPERIMQCLPKDWNEGWDNVMLLVTAENQENADRRIGQLLQIPSKHYGIIAGPLLEEIRIEGYLELGKIEEIGTGGENYADARECRYEWIESLSRQCYDAHINFAFRDPGQNFWRCGKHIAFRSKREQYEYAEACRLNTHWNDIEWNLISCREHQLELF